MNRRLGGSQIRSGRRGEEKNLLPLPGFELRTVQPLSLSLFRLCCTASHIKQIRFYLYCSRFFPSNLTSAAKTIYWCAPLNINPFCCYLLIPKRNWKLMTINSFLIAKHCEQEIILIAHPYGLKNLYAPLLFPHTCHMPRPSHSFWFDHPNNISSAVQISKLLVMQSSPLHCYLVPLRPK